MSEIFGKILKELRNEKGLTQEKLAKVFSVSKMTISAWERNKQEPCIDDIVKLTKFFNISSDYLLGIENDFVQNINNKSLNTNIQGNRNTIQNSFNKNFL